ncbi:uncharacterized protein TNCV_1524441 [Trichonephila clavipes]|nr:uncharacterized protein TNCV_1524441 [Trichonephila clavipes]
MVKNSLSFLWITYCLDLLIPYLRDLFFFQMTVSSIGKNFTLWVPSRCGNEIADDLAREGNHKNSTHSGCLTFSEVATRVKQEISSSWKQAPVHEWLKETMLGFAVDMLELNGMCGS